MPDDPRCRTCHRRTDPNGDCGSCDADLDYERYSRDQLDDLDDELNLEAAREVLADPSAFRPATVDLAERIVGA